MRKLFDKGWNFIQIVEWKLLQLLLLKFWLPLIYVCVYLFIYLFIYLFSSLAIRTPLEIIRFKSRGSVT